MKRTLITVAVLAGLCLTGLAQAKTVKAALSQALPKVELTGVSLADAYDFVRDVSGLNIHVNWRVLEGIGISKDTAVTLRLRQVSVRSMLNMLCAQSGAADKVTWYLEDNIIEITSREEADKVMITIVYPVEDLLLEIPNFTNAPDFNLDTNGSSSNSGASNSGSGGLGLSGNGNNTGGRNGSSSDEPTKTKKEKGDALVKLIQDTIRPEIWRDNGGPASIRIFNGSLIVTAPRSVHQLISSR